MADYLDQKLPERSAMPSSAQTSVDAFPLLPADPPRIGDWWIDARIVARSSGVAFLAHSDDGTSTMLILLSQGAAADAAARDRLAGEVNRMNADTVIARGGQGQDEGRLGYLFFNPPGMPAEPDQSPTAPWVVLAWDGSINALAEADRLLRVIDLSGSPELGMPRGPHFALPWIGYSRSGSWRSWPLSWPHRKDRTGWVPMLASWLLIVLVGSLALLIAALIFQAAPPSGGGGGGEGQSSASTSTVAQEPSAGDSASDTSSASPSDSASSSSDSSAEQSPSQTPSMNASGSGSASSSQNPSAPQSRL